MAIRDIFKVSRKTFFNPREWIGADSLRDQTQSIKSFIKDAATVQKPERTETFDQALERLEIKQSDLKGIAQTYLVYAFIFLGLALLDFTYGFYLLFYQGTFLGLILALAVCALLLAQAFRYHFWFFQIKSRRLGCTYAEWREDLLGKKRKSS